MTASPTQSAGLPISVVVPAHQEEAGIVRCLDALFANARPTELEVVVVCNGCTDQTARLATAFGRGVKVVETPVASKSGALNLGDGHVAGFPRAYVDADVELTTSALRDLVDACRRPGVLAAVPVIRLDVTGRGLLVKAFTSVWTSLPFFQDGMASSGVYVLSREGRGRFGAFPDIMADDHFVLSGFDGTERRQVRSAHCVVQAPRSLADVVRIKTRAFIAERQLQARGEQDTRQHGPRSSWLGVVARRPRLWPAAPVYLLVNVVAEVRARWKYARGDYSWERDASSRADRTG